MDECSNTQEPPQTILSLEDTAKLVDQVTKDLSKGSYASIQSSILCLSSNLKHHGPSLELQHGEHLDRLQLVLRPSCRDHKLDLMSRVLLLEMIELRTFDWAPSQNVSNYYKMKLQQINGELLAGDHHSPSAQGYSNAPYSRQNFPSSHGTLRHTYVSANSPGFRLGTSHLLMNIPNRPSSVNHLMNVPNRPAAPNSLNNIPNRPAASNLFMNIPNRPAASMNFPNLPANPIFSNFQQPPAGRKQYEDILQNPSNSGDHSMEEVGDKSAKQTINVHTQCGDLVLTSLSSDLLHTVEKILQEELSDEILLKSGSSSTSSLGSSKPELVYPRPELLKLASSPVCRTPPKDWDNILMGIPDIVKSSHRVLKEVPRIAQNKPIK